jgi:hypothetical protein
MREVIDGILSDPVASDPDSPAGCSSLHLLVSFSWKFPYQKAGAKAAEGTYNYSRAISKRAARYHTHVSNVTSR